MAEHSTKKLNWLERQLPEGLLVDAAWLTRHGYSSALRTHYVSAGWLEQPARGVFRRPRGGLRWEQVVISLQTLLEYPLVVGGRTALEVQGFAHFLPKGQAEVHLYGSTPMPHWVNKLPFDTEFVFHNSARLFPDDAPGRGVQALNQNVRERRASSMEPWTGDVVTEHWGQWDWPLAQSTPERALLELLDELPRRETFDQVDKLMEGLVSLSPRRLQGLLERCRSVKVKRLFFFFADRHHHPWRTRIDLASIDLGKGKRMLVRGGALDPTYQITVPEDMRAVH